MKITLDKSLDAFFVDASVDIPLHGLEIDTSVDFAPIVFGDAFTGPGFASASGGGSASGTGFSSISGSLSASVTDAGEAASVLITAAADDFSIVIEDASGAVVDLFWGV